jgi:hypothetical protein
MALTGMLLILACDKEKSFEHNIIPLDPEDSTFRQIKGLVITPSSPSDSVIKLHIETTNKYPVTHTKLEAFCARSPAHRPDTIYVNVYGIQPLFPYTPGSAPAKTDLCMKRNPGVNIPFIIEFKNAVYIGSISTKGANYTISWAHDSVVLISPKTFSR